MINIVSIVCRFMKNWKRQSPSSYCFLRYDKLYIDNRLFVWDKERQDVVEQGEVPGGPPAASRWGHSITIEPLKTVAKFHRDRRRPLLDPSPC